MYLKTSLFFEIPIVWYYITYMWLEVHSEWYSTCDYHMLTW